MNPELELRKFYLALLPFAEAFRRYNDPGVSDLDNEQPTSIHVNLGYWREALYLINQYQGRV